jgi:hypothetical protein
MTGLSPAGLWPCRPLPPLSSRTVGFPESGWQPWPVPRGPSQASRGLNPRRYPPLECVVIPLARRLERLSPLSGPESRRCCLCGARHVPRAPLPETGATRLRGMSGIPSEGATPPSSLLRAHAPHQNPLADLDLHPIPRVLAGCGEPLLEGGGSRRYLRNPCIGAWSHTPPRSPGAPTRFFPVDIGLTSHLTRSARETLLQATSTG